MRLQILAVLLFVVAASAVDLHIIKGKDSKPHTKPWLLTMWRNGNGDRQPTRRNSDCGASLLRLSPYQKSSDIALTAAHCIGNGHNLTGDARKDEPCHGKTKLFQEHSVVISNHYLEQKDKNEKEIKVIDGQCHKDWIPENFKDDIALLKLAEPVPFSDTVEGIDLAELGEKLAPGTICNAAGWGAINFFDNHPLKPIEPKVLQELDVEVANFAIVSKYHTVDSKRMIVTTPKNGEGGECHGDSGGPLVCQKNGKSVQYGVLSHGDKCHEVVKPFFAFYSSVSYYRDWINQEIEKLQRKKLYL
jgi:hypothetical protein